MRTDRLVIIYDTTKLSTKKNAYFGVFVWKFIDGFLRIPLGLLLLLNVDIFAKPSNLKKGTFK